MTHRKHIKFAMYKTALLSLAVLLAMPFGAWAIDITGTVFDDQGDPLPGASVKVMKDSKVVRGVVTGDNGEWTLDNLNATDNLQISFLGYETQTFSASETEKLKKVQLADGSPVLEGLDVATKGCIDEKILKKLHAKTALARGANNACVPQTCITPYYELNAKKSTKEEDPDAGTKTVYTDAECVLAKCNVPHSVNGSEQNKYKCDSDDKNCYCYVEECAKHYNPSKDHKSCVQFECTEAETENLKKTDSNILSTKFEKSQCVVEECKPDYTPSGRTCKRTQKCTAAEEQSLMAKDSNITKTEYIDNKCVVVDCVKNYRPNKEKNGCERYQGECTTEQINALTAKDQKIKKTKQEDGKCIVTGCVDDYKPNEAEDGCIQAKGACSPDVEHATTGEMKKGVCVVTECEKGYNPDQATNTCIASKLSEQGSLNQIEDLKKVAKDAKDKEQSTANKTLGATSMLATGLGGQQLLSGLAEKSADQDAEEDMRAYLATFACDYGRGRNIKGGETSVELPGGNELITSRQEYVALASDLKERKESLGLRAGIESEVILDKATTGLYDDVGVGITGGKYASVSRALLDENSADAAAWAQQKSDAASKIKTGATIAGIGVIGGLVGDIAINGKNSSVKEALNQVLYKNEYEGFNGVFAPLNNTKPQIVKCPDGSERGNDLKCKCNLNEYYVATGEGGECKPCTGGRVSDGIKECHCPEDTPIWDNSQCTARQDNTCTPECDNSGKDTNLFVDNNCQCLCLKGFTYNKTTKKCECNDPSAETEDGICAPKPTFSPNVQIENNNTTIEFVLSASALFDLNKSDLSAEAKIALSNMYNAMDDNQTCNLDIFGYTDPSGGDRINKPLSQKRADAVKTYLQQQTGKQNLRINFTAQGNGSNACTCNVIENIQGIDKNNINWDAKDYSVCKGKTSEQNQLAGTKTYYAPCRRIRISTTCKATKTNTNTIINNVSQIIPNYSSSTTTSDKNAIVGQPCAPGDCRKGTKVIGNNDSQIFDKVVDTSSCKWRPFKNDQKVCSPDKLKSGFNDWEIHLAKDNFAQIAQIIPCDLSGCYDLTGKGGPNNGVATECKTQWSETSDTFICLPTANGCKTGYHQAKNLQCEPN